jgi:hypothetical protein
VDDDYTKFAQDCSTSYQNENPSVKASCPLQCAYDVTKFTTMDHILDYEKKYGKYEKDPTTWLTQEDAPYSSNYDDIMVHFCSQRSTTCNIDPYTITNNKGGSSTPTVAPYCSLLKSATPEGLKCRAWLDNHGMDKYSLMSRIGNIYCKENQNSYDCRCFNRTLNSDFNGIQGYFAPEISPACYYVPCADPTNYIVGSDIMKSYQADEGSGGNPYGFYCGDTICANILNMQTDDPDSYGELEGNTLYVQCGDGTLLPTEGAWGKLFKEIPVIIQNPFDHPIAAVAIYILLIIFIVFGFFVSVKILSGLKKIFVYDSFQTSTTTTTMEENQPLELTPSAAASLAPDPAPALAPDPDPALAPAPSIGENAAL